MMVDRVEYVKKCIPCQNHCHLSHQNHEKLHNISFPWPYTKWGMNIIGPFTLGRGHVKFIVVVVDYFIKWIEAEPLVTITIQ